MKTKKILAALFSIAALGTTFAYSKPAAAVDPNAQFFGIDNIKVTVLSAGSANHNLMLLASGFNFSKQPFATSHQYGKVSSGQKLTFRSLGVFDRFPLFRFQDLSTVLPDGQVPVTRQGTTSLGEDLIPLPRTAPFFKPQHVTKIISGHGATFQVEMDITRKPDLF